jgi:RimJ/RimL family protein N-acetyltransferase
MLTIRPMEEFDVKFFNETRNECKDFLHDNSSYSFNDSLNWFRNTKPKFYILERNDEKIGYFRTKINENNEFYVGADINIKYRGMGYAKESYQMFFDLLKAEFNLKEVYLEVFESNERAHSLYKKLGFYEIERYNLERGISIKMKKEL